jgi:putative hydrolase
MKYLIDTHTHTIASGHAYNTIDEMTKMASDLKLQNLAITDHAPKMPGAAGNIYFSNLKVVPRRKYDVNRFMGVEANIIDYTGRIDFKESLLKKMDIVIASFHIPCIKSGNKQQNTQALLGAMENPYVHIIGHPDDSRYPIDYEAVVKKAKATHKLLELNNSSLRPDNPREGAYDNDRLMLSLCKKYDVCITLGSDAHVAEDICNFTYAEQLLCEMDFPKRLIVNTDMDLFRTYVKPV